MNLESLSIARQNLDIFGKAVANSQDEQRHGIPKHHLGEEFSLCLIILGYGVDFEPCLTHEGKALLDER
ncbi:hypothetical protein [Bosea thiooxidans]